MPYQNNEERADAGTNARIELEFWCLEKLLQEIPEKTRWRFWRVYLDHDLLAAVDAIRVALEAGGIGEGEAV